MNICDLPHDILENIFSYLDCDELPELTEVCPRFNEVISTSYQLMSTFMVYWSKSSSKQQDLRPLLKSKRKYQKMQVEEVVGIKPNLHNFLTKHANTLSDVNFYDCSFKTTEFTAAITALADNLKFLGMCDVNFEQDGDEVKPIKFRQLNYMEIMYGNGEGFSCIINLFTGAKTIKTITYEDDFQMNEKEAAKFSTFLQSLDDLVDLTLSYNVAQKMFLNEDFNNAVKFKLTRFYIDVNPPPHRFTTKAKKIVYKHLNNFISNQTSLDELIVRHAKITTDRLEFFLGLNVKKLGLVSCEITQSRKLKIKNSTIQSLFLSLDEEIEENSAEESVTCDILENCSSIKNIHFTCTELTFEMMLAIRNCKCNIEKFTMFRCSFFPMNLPSLKKLDVGGLVDHDETISLIRLNPQLKELRVPGCLRHFPKFAKALQELSLECLILC